jgi:sortase A
VRFKRHGGLVLSIIGFLLMGYGIYEVASGRIYQVWKGRELDRALDTLPPAPRAHRAVPYEQGSAIGRLDIPRLGLSVVVLEGSDAGTLRLGVGRLRNSALPSEPGNVVIAGHRDTFFRSLREIQPGDEISLRTPEGAFSYTVDWTKVVKPTDTSVIMPTTSAALTLVTCYPFYYVGSAPERFIVRAQPPGTMSTVSPVTRRPSPFGESPKPVTRAAAAPVTVSTAAAESAEGAQALKPASIAAAAAPAGDPGTSPESAEQLHPGRLKRALHKIAGVFSSHHDKLQ